MQHDDQAVYYRRRAEESRRKADMCLDASLALIYREFAAGFETKAEQHERRHRLQI